MILDNFTNSFTSKPVFSSTNGTRYSILAALSSSTVSVPFVEEKTGLEKVSELVLNE